MKLIETVEFNLMNMHESSSALDGFKLPTEDLHAVPLLPAGVRVPIEARVPTPLKRERERERNVAPCEVFSYSSSSSSNYFFGHNSLPRLTC